MILTPDQRVRVFVSSTMEELADERAAVRRAVEHLHLSPVLFELGARAHPPRSLYLSYMDQSHIFLGIYWQRYGWIAPGMDVSGLEDEYLLSGSKPKLIYVKRPAPEREERLERLLDRIRASEDVAYKAFSTADELERLVAEDIAVLLSETFLIAPTTEPARRPRLHVPTGATTFIGRTSELEALRKLVTRDDVRLVTLTGPGGVGKTRLALRVAAEVAPSFDEGAVFVALATIGDPNLVPDAIAAAVGLRDVAGDSLRQALRDDLADRSLLLLVDNAEHVIAVADLLSELLDGAGRVKALVTSREALRVQAEHEFPVLPLQPTESMLLFEQRAAAARYGFALDDTNTATIAAICQRLEHVPLAIELAAARVKTLSPEAMLERLGRPLDFLVGGARDLPERQRALRNTMQWSYDLLDGHERQLFATLGVFVGSFSLEAVEALHDGAAGPEALDVLASLVDKSLLRAESGAGEPRFRMLEMIREFARERLDERADAEAVGERHAELFRELSQRVSRGVRGPDQIHWLGILGRGEGDADNVRAALVWFLDHRRLEACAEMAWALWVPAWINGRLDEAQGLADAALAAGGELPERLRARLLVVSGLFAMWKGAHGAAVRSLAEGLAMGRALDDDELVAYATVATAMVTGPLEGEEHAIALMEDGVERCRRMGDRWGEAVALNALGWLYVGQERFDATAAVFDATISSATAVGDEHVLAMAEVNQAELELHRGDLDAAAALLGSSATRHRSLRSMYSVAYLLDASARLALVRGDAPRAGSLLGAADHLRGKVGVGMWGSQLERRRVLVEHVTAALGRDGFAEAAAAGGRLGYAEALDLVAAVAPAG